MDFERGLILIVYQFYNVKKSLCYLQLLFTGIIYVIDSTNTIQLSKYKDEISNLILEFPEKPILVFANKQDLPTAMDKSKMIQKLNFEEFGNKKLLVVECSAYSGDNLKDGFKKLCEIK